MGHFVYDEDLIQIDLEDGEWVKIASRMSYGMQQKLIASYMRLQTQLKTLPDFDMDVETGNITLLLLNIKEWSLKDKSGRVAPINEQTIRMLDPAVATKIINVINEQNPPPKV